MARRKIILIIYYYNENWIGGVYYIQNLIYALKTLPDEKKPIISIYSNKSNIDELYNIKYPYLNHFNKNSKIFKLINRISKKLFLRNIFSANMKFSNFDLIFPIQEDRLELIKNKGKFLFWIPDFQSLVLKEYFSEESQKERNTFYNLIIENNYPILLSSNAAYNDFKSFFPDAKNKVYVVPFAVTNILQINQFNNSLFKKYNITKPYFIICNQFWVHKNHLTVFEAFSLLSKKIKDCIIVCTGKTFDYRQPDYFSFLSEKCKELDVYDKIIFTGMIDREEQLSLMANSLAIIQPSLFEGWSTVIEDAKYLNKFVFASDLDVHYEQLNNNSVFFEQKNAPMLADLLENFYLNQPELKKNDYNKNIADFGNRLFNLINDFK